MSVIQVWKDGKRKKDARLLQKRSLKRKKEDLAETHPLPVPRTGLNYVELTYEKYMAEQKEKAQQGLFNLLEKELRT